MKKTLVIICLFVFLPTVALAVDFSFSDLVGKTYTGADLQGTPLVINVGTHW